MAQRHGGGPFCVASAACRVGRLDFREEGCLERLLLDADPLGLCPLCGRVEIGKRKTENLLLAGAVLFRPGLNGQTDTSDAPVCPAAAGLVAVAPDASSSS